MSVYISERAELQVREAFENVSLVTKSAPVYDAVATHPDIYMCRMPEGNVIKARPGEVGDRYPDNIAFNAVCLDRYFIHNIKYTNPRLLQAAMDIGLTPVNVEQGYTKCSCVVVDGKSVITADESIYSALAQLPDINVLKVTQGHVELLGFEYGFMGGASGKVGDTLYFTGDIAKHPDGSQIEEFVRGRGVKIKCFTGALKDIGSIIEEVY